MQSYQIENLIKSCKEHALYNIPNEEKDLLCYKKIKNEILIVMKKLQDILSNEKREHIYDVNNATYRANKLYVIKIFNIFTKKRYDKVVNVTQVYFDTPPIFTIYKKNTIVYANDFNHDLSKTYSSGIHYYKSIETTLYFHSKSLFDKGILKGFYIYYLSNGLIVDKLCCMY